ncbi:probable nucleolar GTPase [Cephalotrichum gorgonifer]|uniref:Nucleolar GTP-binding protein 2 n=1 Tax=Cephalotrichum gorgonifer TaxID=2041049 RepID=A0AAE8N4D6_9PEZI|nr:probable nucleolar GTPase [Cephalotrichum gorgonifer]
MGKFKKEKSRRGREGKSSDGMANVRTKGENFYHDAKKVKALNMRQDHGPSYNRAGRLTQAAQYQSRDVPQARIEPNRKWFTNTRVISQDSLTSFREAMAEKASDPFQVLLKSNKLPMGLLKEDKSINGLKQHQAKMAVESAPFADVFGPKAQRKRVKTDVGSLMDLAGAAEKNLETYHEAEEQARYLRGEGDNKKDGTVDVVMEPIFNKGGSKRIWNELYKVLDSSDVILHVLDARDPEGTRCRSVEKYLKNEAPHKHLVFVLNKCDLVPSSVAAAWVRLLSKDHPTLAFHASITRSFGKGSLISLLRQFSSLHAKNRKDISIGMIGYPNVGKSSIINTLKSKKVCTVAPIPGETKVWQYISLMKRISLIDCPGIVPPNMNDTPEDILLRGVVRIENVENPSQYIEALMNKVKLHHLERTYELKGWTDYMGFLEMVARKSGRLLKGGEPDIEGVAKMVVHDFLRGKIPWFTPCPTSGTPAAEGDAIRVGREGLLGEMPLKRKRDEAESVAASAAPSKDDEDDDEEFAGFDTNAESGDEDAASKEDADDDDDSNDEFEDAEDRISLDVSSDEESEVEGAEKDDGADASEALSSKGTRPSKRRRK